MTAIRIPAEKRIDESMQGCPSEIAADQCFTLSAMEWDEIKAELRRLRRYEEIADSYPDTWDVLVEEWQAENGPFGVGA